MRVTSTAIPGMKWSTVLVTASIGTRVTADHVVPLVDVLITMSLEVQPGAEAAVLPDYVDLAAGRYLGGRKRTGTQVPSHRVVANCGDRYRRAPCIPAVRGPEGAFGRAIGLIGDDGDAVRLDQGWPPSPEGLPDGVLVGPHVSPPSVEVLICIRLPDELLSHSA